MVWIPLSEAHPPVVRSVPNDLVKCPCCEPMTHEVSDYVLVRNDRGEIVHARWNKTAEIWETYDDYVVMNFTHWSYPEPLTLENMTGGEITVVYRNWKDELGVRHIRPLSLFFGANEWHHEPQWLILANDLDKGDVRTFALSGITAVGS